MDGDRLVRMRLCQTFGDEGATVQEIADELGVEDIGLVMGELVRLGCAGHVELDRRGRWAVAKGLVIGPTETAQGEPTAALAQRNGPNRRSSGPALKSPQKPFERLGPGELGEAAR